MKMPWCEFVVYHAPSLVLCISHVQHRLISFSIFIDSGLSPHSDTLPGIPIPICKVLNELPLFGDTTSNQALLFSSPFAEPSVPVPTHPCSFVRNHRHTSIVTTQLHPRPFPYLLFLSYIRPANGMFPLLPKYHRHNHKSIIMPLRQRRLADPVASGGFVAQYKLHRLRYAKQCQSCWSHLFHLNCQSIGVKKILEVGTLGG